MALILVSVHIKRFNVSIDTEQIGSITLVHAPQMKSNIPLTKTDPQITLTFGNLSLHLFWNVRICFAEYD